ncbi:MAG: hypothetical protein JRE12_10210 [Deltaproteobacteria bacterium]|nr:hypothetical protein [Deltaproteobacteria bacterium]
MNETDLHRNTVLSFLQRGGVLFYNKFKCISFLSDSQLKPLSNLPWYKNYAIGNKSAELYSICIVGTPPSIHLLPVLFKASFRLGNSSLKKQFPETCKKAGIVHGSAHRDGITFHDIRRTVKTNMLMAGVDRRI